MFASRHGQFRATIRNHKKWNDSCMSRMNVNAGGFNMWLINIWCWLVDAFCHMAEIET